MDYPRPIEGRLATFLAPTDLPAPRQGDGPRVSVVVPSYQQAKYLERTLVSIIRQEYPNLELIVMDGGSTDGSADIIRRYERWISYWQSEKDGGQSAAINAGLRRATGDILAYLNSDDILLPTAPLHHAARELTDRGVGVVYGHAYVIDAVDAIIGFAAGVPYDLRSFVTKATSIPQPASFWRREVFEVVRGFNETTRTCMDGEFYLAAARAGFTLRASGKVWAGFRMHPESVSGSQRWEKEYLERLEQLRAPLPQPGALEASARRWRSSARRALGAYRHHPDVVLGRS